ncbi:hypothetical protein LTR50_002961 [Elasticomyces elasticus]|nr:hypothetical protein LTR50_002961 [Elasticomyces elasticus]
MSDATKYTQKLKDSRVLVIGGSSGIGYGVAEACLEHGAHVTISSSNPARIDAAIKKLQSTYPSCSSKISGHVCNLGDESTLEDNVKELFGKVGKLDHIAYTAGDSLAILPLARASMVQIRQAGMVRFFAPLMVAKHGVGALARSPSSTITLTTGSVAERPIPDWTIIGSYCAGLQAMARGLALDLAPVRVNLVSPGVVDTELWAGMPEGQKAEMMEAVEKKLPTGRAGRVEDVAEAYLYAMKDRNLTGSMISTNGGGLIVG